MSKELTLRISTEPFDEKRFPDLELAYPIGAELGRDSVMNYGLRILRLNEELGKMVQKSGEGVTHVFNVRHIDDEYGNVSKVLGDAYFSKDNQ